MSVALHNGTKVHFVGDSITQLAWFSVAGGFVDQVNAILSPGAIVVTATGYSGQVTSEFAADMNTRVFAYNPDVVVLEVGTNDISVGTGMTIFSTAYASILSQIAAWKPGTPVLCIEPMLYNEQWFATFYATGVTPTVGRGVVQSGNAGVVHTIPGPAWGPNIYDYRFQSYCDAIAAAVTTAGQTLALNRAPALVYEAAHNTPAIGAVGGILTADGAHPNSTGKVFLGNNAILKCAVS